MPWAFTILVTPTLTRIAMGLVDWFLDLSRPCLEWWHCWGRLSIGQRYGIHRREIMRGKSSEGSVRRFVVAGLAAGSAVKEAIGAEAHAQFGLAGYAIFFAAATHFRPLTLDADDAAYTWFRGHGRSLIRPGQGWNITEVTEEQVSGVRCQVSGKATPCFCHWFVFLVSLTPET